MEKRKKEERKQHPASAESPVGDLLPEILSEILSRVPYRSLCRFKCVSKAWLALCSDPAVRRRSPQTLSGFFCYSKVFVFVQSFSGIQKVQVYSSETGKCITMSSEWSHENLFLDEDSGCVFFDGSLHLATRHPVPRMDPQGAVRSMVTVDTERETWRKIRMPVSTHNGFFGQSQGRLYCAHVRTEDRCRLMAWVLEDHASGLWTLKCDVSILDLLGRRCCVRNEFYEPVAIHPQCSLIFIQGGVKGNKMLMSYDMDSGKLDVLCSFGDRQPRRFKPYLPCFAEKPAL